MGRPQTTSIIYSEERSDLNIKHGAVLSKGSKPIFNGMNTEQSLSKKYTFEHAE